jgi:hypothetical protein
MVKGVTTFAENKFFKTIFAGGDDVVAEEKANKQKEIDQFNEKLVVENKHFLVNTKFLES